MSGRQGNRAPHSLFEKLWQSHVVGENGDDEALLYIDRHLVYEVTSPQAFEGLRLAKRTVRRPSTVLATVDHNVPTLARDRVSEEAIPDAMARAQVRQLGINCRDFGIRQFGLGSPQQGIVHVVGPEQGATLPGMSIVAGDSHTSTHGAFAALAFGIGTSDVEHVLATQCLWVRRAGSMRIMVEGLLPQDVSAKDLVLKIIGLIGTAGASGMAIEFAGSAIRGMSMESRMTLCNMAIEAGARYGLIGVDETTIAYLNGRPLAPSGREWDAAVAHWRQLKSDPDATFDREIRVDAPAVEPMVTWGTSPEMVVPVSGAVPDPSLEADPVRRASMQSALRYMGLVPGTPMRQIQLDKIFIGSCTNSRIEDLRVAAEIVRGNHTAPCIKQALVVPGSGLVKAQAEQEGLDKVFVAAGFEWREPGCSMCLGMNDDRLSPGERCASTSNRNFEGRQGPGGRSHLVSPQMAARAAIAGTFDC